MISVVIPVYNVEKYIRDCINSLKHQTFDDFEVVFVDDGSTDTSLQIIKQQTKDFAGKFILVEQENRGVSVARNRGIEKAIGEYICFVDSDDILDPKYLETLYCNMVKYEADVSVINKCDIDEFVHTYECKYEQTHIESLSKTQALNWLLKGKIRVGIWGIMTKKSILKDLRFAEGVAYSEDLEMVWKLIASSEKIVVSNMQLYGYRLRDSSAMAKIDSKRVQGLRLFEELEFFIKDNAPDFIENYQKFGVAKWLWSTLWQEALASGRYAEFNKSIEKYGDLSSIKNLLGFPNIKVRTTAALFCMSPKLYYCFIRILLLGRCRTIERVE